MEKIDESSFSAKDSTDVSLRLSDKKDDGPLNQENYLKSTENKDKENKLKAEKYKGKKDVGSFYQQNHLKSAEIKDKENDHFTKYFPKLQWATTVDTLSKGLKEHYNILEAAIIQEKEQKKISDMLIEYQVENYGETFREGKKKKIFNILNLRVQEGLLDPTKDEDLAKEMLKSGEEGRFEVLHTIICIDTSGSMENQIQRIQRIVANYLEDTFKRNREQESHFEVPTVVCFGQEVLRYVPPITSVHEVETAARETDTWMQNYVFGNRIVGYGRTPLPEGLKFCLCNHNDVKDRLTLLHQRNLESRVIMFSDGFPTAIFGSTSNIIDEDECTAGESELEEIRTEVAVRSRYLTNEKIPIYCVLMSPMTSNQTILTGISDITNGNVILPEDVMVLGKYFEQKRHANDLSDFCHGLNWHQVVANVMLRIKSHTFLYYELVAKLICERGNIEICKNRHIAFHHLQRPLRKVLSKWQVRHNNHWEDYPKEVNDRIEEEFQKHRLTGLSSVYFEHSNARYRIYFDEMKERQIGTTQERDVMRLNLGEW